MRPQTTDHRPQKQKLACKKRQCGSYVFCLMSHVLYLFLFFQFSNSLSAQDLHFSQFYAAPIYYNPANTGLFNADYRLGGNYKNQWPWARGGKPTNYRTFSAYADIPFLKGKLLGQDKIGVGIIAATDRAGDGNLTTTRIGASAAYHKSLGYENRFALSFGVSGLYTQKKVDYDALYFDNQWSDSFFDRTLASGEGKTGIANFGYFDLSAGVMVTYFPNKKMNFSLGTGVFHLNKPKESFSNGSNRLGIRPNIISTGYITLGNRFHIEPSLMWGYQKKAQEFLAAIIAGYTLVRSGITPQHILLFGVSGRVKDALIPVVGYQFKTFRFMINYDVNISSLTQASRVNGGLELSFVYMGYKPTTKNKLMIPCPRL
jgi:type IX secretion system PorP/SprF family membrane protein